MAHLERVYTTTVDPAFTALELAAGAVTTQGAPAGSPTGGGYAADAAAGTDTFLGFWDETEGDPDSADAEHVARCRQRGQIATGDADWPAAPAASDVGSAVGYTLATNQFALGGGDIQVGKLVGVESARGVYVVYFEGAGVQSI